MFNVLVINSMKPSANVPWIIANIIMDVGYLPDQAEEMKFQHCFKEANRATNFMVHKGYSVTPIQMF